MSAPSIGLIKNVPLVPCWTVLFLMDMVGSLDVVAGLVEVSKDDPATLEVEKLQLEEDQPNDTNDMAKYAEEDSPLSSPNSDHGLSSLSIAGATVTLKTTPLSLVRRSLHLQLS